MSSPLVSRDLAETAANVKSTFSSWDTCMDKAYCKWPVIVGIIVGSLVILSILWCFARCLCCGAECACCCFRCCASCCPSPTRKDRGHKRVGSNQPDSLPYNIQKPVNTQYQSAAAPAYEPPQFARFSTSGKPVNEDALPPMPSWKDARDAQVVVEETAPAGTSPCDMEMQRMGPHNPSNPALATTTGAPTQQNQPYMTSSTAQSPVSPQMQQGYMPNPYGQGPPPNQYGQGLPPNQFQRQGSFNQSPTSPQSYNAGPQVMYGADGSQSYQNRSMSPQVYGGQGQGPPQPLQGGYRSPSPQTFHAGGYSAPPQGYRSPPPQQQPQQGYSNASPQDFYPSTRPTPPPQSYRLSPPPQAASAYPGQQRYNVSPVHESSSDTGYSVAPPPSYHTNDPAAGGYGGGYAQTAGDYHNQQQSYQQQQQGYPPPRRPVNGSWREV